MGQRQKPILLYKLVNFVVIVITLVRVLQKGRINRIYVDRQMREDSLGEFVHIIMEAEKFHNSLSPSWRTRKAGSMAHSRHKGLRIREASGVTLILRPKV